LLLRHFPIRVHKLDRIAVRLECKGSLIASNGLIGEGLEDLLQSRLRNAILFNAQISLLVLELAEEPADRPVFLRDAQLEEFAALLQNFHLLEVFEQVGENAEAERLRFEEVKEVAKAHLAV